jgi:hypothetical protein
MVEVPRGLNFSPTVEMDREVVFRTAGGIVAVAGNQQILFASADGLSTMLTFDSARNGYYICSEHKFIRHFLSFLAVCG